MIYLTSDLHIGHNKEFIYKTRGYESIDAMANAEELDLLNLLEDDVLYILGDVMLGDNTRGMEILRKTKCHIIIVRGNHDTDTRVELYKTLPNVTVLNACYIHYNGYHFFCTHYPCITSGLEKDSLKSCTCNFFGHTHSKDKFYLEMPFMLNVAWDTWHKVISIDEAIETMEEKVKDCLAYL